MTSPIHQCKECVDLLGDYIEGTLPPDRSQALEDHLSKCPPCITFVRTYRATRKLCRSALSREMPQELVHRLSTFLEKHVPGFHCSGAPDDDKEPKKV